MTLLGFTLSKIEGRSMLPGLIPGSYGLFKRARTSERGHTVLVEHPRFGRIVKQVKNKTPSGVTLCGTSVDSTPSEVLGVVSQTAILGRLIWVSRPPVMRRAEELP